ncbi:MFS transporter [Ornithinibacillus bavariensis]|nr:MFS transporter [Ornithinibacillus bavariensis]
MDNIIISWKNPIRLLTSVGLARVGDFIYLVAINILVFQMTGSAAAVAGLWVIGPMVNLLTKFWTGSFIDYRSKRKIMIITYIFRAFLVFCIPFSPSIWLIYLILVFLSVAQSFFQPSSMTYTTQLIPKEIRKRFNSINSLTSSGAFIMGPAIAGALILVTNVNITLVINSVAFLLAAILLLLLPETDNFEKNTAPKLSFKQIKDDFTVSITFMRENSYVAFVYISFLATTIFTFAMDTQEVVFTQLVVGLTEMDYSMLISITGIGAIVGAFLVSIFTKGISIRLLIITGIIMQTIGYLIYAFSWSFLSIATGFVILGFFNTFLNTGIVTFYQNNIPVDKMGRITSIFQLFQSSVQIIFVLLVGAVAELIPLRLTIIILSICMLVVAIIITVAVLHPVKKGYFKEA